MRHKDDRQNLSLTLAPNSDKESLNIPSMPDGKFCAHHGYNLSGSWRIRYNIPKSFCPLQHPSINQGILWLMNYVNLLLNKRWRGIKYRKNSGYGVNSLLGWIRNGGYHNYLIFTTVFYFQNARRQFYGTCRPNPNIGFTRRSKNNLTIQILEHHTLTQNSTRGKWVV